MPFTGTVPVRGIAVKPGVTPMAKRYEPSATENTIAGNGAKRASRKAAAKGKAKRAKAAAKPARRPTATP